VALSFCLIEFFALAYHLNNSKWLKKPGPLGGKVPGFSEQRSQIERQFNCLGWYVGQPPPTF